VVWRAFFLGIAVSLAANIAAAPVLDWHETLVAGWPPVALLLSVELLTHDESNSSPRETLTKARPERDDRPDHPHPSEPRDALASPGQSAATVLTTPRRKKGGSNAEAAMWAHFQQQQAQGRNPTGAELDRIAGTNNYGRAVLARWRRTGRIPSTPHRRPTKPNSPISQQSDAVRRAGQGADSA
jgi:hypothetical protein